VTSVTFKLPDVSLLPPPCWMYTTLRKLPHAWKL